VTLRRAAVVEERVDDAEYVATLELNVTGDPRVISEHVARRFQQLTVIPTWGTAHRPNSRSAAPH